MSDSVMRIGSDHDNARLDLYLRMTRESDPKEILELGTLRWEANRPTHHMEWFEDADWTLADTQEGIDSDIATDAHHLTEFGDERFDSVIAVSVWEHLERPWLAAEAVARVMRPGATLYIATHQTFPIHGYPDDFFRFSDRALRLIFEDAGLEVIDAGYSYRAQIVPPAVVTRWNPHAEAWLNVDLVAVK